MSSSTFAMVLTQKAFVNLAALATSEEKAISLWRSMRSWGVKGEYEAGYIAEMKTLYPGFVDEVLDNRPRPSHLAALSARGHELTQDQRRRLLRYRQTRVTRDLVRRPWIREMAPGERDNLIYSRDPHTRTYAAIARYLPTEERVAAMMATDAKGTPWFELEWRDPLNFGWDIPVTAALDLPISQIVESWSLYVHQGLTTSAVTLMSEQTLRRWFSQMADVVERMAAHSNHMMEIWLGRRLANLIRERDWGPQVNQMLDELHGQINAVQREKVRRGGHYVALTAEGVAAVAETYRKVAKVVTGPPEDSVFKMPDDVLKSGNLNEIAERHAVSPLTPEEMEILAERIHVKLAGQPAYLGTASLAAKLAELQISSEAAAAFYRACVRLGSPVALRPPKELVELMTTEDAVSALLAPVALEYLEPHQLAEALEGRGDIWHETASRWPDTLESLLLITDA